MFSLSPLHPLQNAYVFIQEETPESFRSVLDEGLNPTRDAPGFPKVCTGQMTIKDVARLMEVDEKTVRRWIKNGELHATKDIFGRNPAPYTTPILRSSAGSYRSRRWKRSIAISGSTRLYSIPHVSKGRAIGCVAVKGVLTLLIEKS
jgi:excisionase family DNA binding protein